MPLDTYLIFNADRLIGKEGIPLPGTHWISIASIPDENNPLKQVLLGYDSFGRELKEIHGSDGQRVIDAHPLMKKVVMSEPDPEQLLFEENCGPRSLAFLMVASLWGHTVAKWI